MKMLQQNLVNGANWPFDELPVNSHQ
jgi:hypothetical protein